MSFETFADNLTSPIAWPFWLRRGFCLTLPISVPIYGLILALFIASITLALPLLYLYEELPWLWKKDNNKRREQ